MIVCIAEKPSVAKDIARIIGATASRDGYMEGNGYQVTWTFGHLCELKMPEDYTPMWKAWSLTALPMIPPRFGIRLKDDEGIKKQFAVIERLMQAADGIINCGDAGQEGELIQRWVMQKAGAKCPVQRLWISSMTDEAIREGFATLKDQNQYQSLYMAGLSRAVGDWLLGINCTRLYTIKYGQNRQVLSIGRVQTPTLALIVNRQKEIDNFKPEPYWVLATVYRDTTFTATKGRFTSKEEGEQAFKTIEGKPFTITQVEKKNGKETPPSLYDQQEVRFLRRDHAEHHPAALRAETDHLSTCRYYVPARRCLCQVSADHEWSVPSEACRHGALCRTGTPIGWQAPIEVEEGLRLVEGHRPPRHYPYGHGTHSTHRHATQGLRPRGPSLHRRLLP